MYALKYLKEFGIRPQNVFHIGGHRGDEAGKYKEQGAQTVVFVEAIPEIFKALEQNLLPYPDFFAVCAVCSDVTGAEVDFHVSSNDGGSSSLLGLGNLPKFYPRIHYVETLRLKTTTADDLRAARFKDIHFDTLVLDVQGAELYVLRGATTLLEQAKSLCIEVSEDELYEGGCTLEEVMAYVRQFGFRLRHVQINSKLWGDALFVRP
jgi:FkbM family methyltransferase